MRQIAQQIALFVMLAGCAGRPSVPAKAGVLEVEIEVAHDLAEDAWRVTYQFPEPVRSLRFRDGEYLLRAATWRIETPGVHIVRDGEAEAFACDGAGVRAIVVRIPGGL